MGFCKAMSKRGKIFALHYVINKWLNEKFCPGWGSGEKILFICVLCNMFGNVIVHVQKFVTNFPTRYVTGELMISWHAGLVRRGLVGEILGNFAGYWWLPWGIAGTGVALYGIFVFVAGKILFRYTERVWAILLLGTPGSFCYFFYVSNQIFSKNVIIIIGICVIMTIVVYGTRRMWPCSRTLISITVIFAPLFLIHELALFFIGFPISLLFGFSKSKQERWHICLYTIILAIACLAFAFNFSGTVTQKEGIIEFWTQFYPDLNTTAIGFLGQGLSDRAPENYTLPYLQVYPLRVSIIKAWLLTFLPIAAFWRRYTINHDLAQCCGRFGASLFYGQALVAFLLVITIMNDMGRIFAYFAIFMVISGLAIKTISNAIKPNIPAVKGFAPDFNHPGWFALAALYLFCWQTLNWVPLSAKTYLAPQLWQNILLEN